MKMEDLENESKRATKVFNESFSDWDLLDQLKYIACYEEFLKKIKPIIDKYDLGKPFKFEIRRLDEI